MRIILAIACLALIKAALCVPQNRGFASTIAPFRPTPSSFDDFDEEDNSPSPSQSIAARTPAYGEDNYPIRNTIQLVQQRPQSRPPPQLAPQQFRRPGPPQQFRQQLEEEVKEGALEEKEEEEPDRLTVLLPQSKFQCVGKNTGYYADEGLGCEVFHYCQDNARHSWICPEGFTFHQVHLICMPPSSDNICEQSSQYHFINDYLYKPVNLEEHQNKPNVSLRYSERFYPDKYHYQNFQDEEEEEEPQQQQRQPIRVALQQAPAPVPTRGLPVHQHRPIQTHFSPTFRPETTIGQVFRSPEEVNISLQQRRPPYVSQRYLTQNQDY